MKTSTMYVCAPTGEEAQSSLYSGLSFPESVPDPLSILFHENSVIYFVF